MSIDISKLSFDELTILEKQIKQKKDEMHNSRDAIYKSDAITIDLNNMCRSRFPVSLYPESSRHCSPENEDYTELDFQMYCRLEKALLKICDLTIGNYSIKDDKIKCGGCIVAEHTKEYMALCKELINAMVKYDQLIFENGVKRT